jgi:hypothetical protein
MAENDDFARYLRSEPSLDYIARLQVIQPEWVTPLRRQAAQSSGTIFTRLLQLRQKYAKGNPTIAKFEEDLIRSYLHTENLILKETQARIAETKIEIQKKIEVLRAKTQVLTLDRIWIKGVSKGKMPEFLEQFNDWKKNDVSIPVTGRRSGKEQYRKSLEERQARKKLEQGENSEPQKKMEVLTDADIVVSTGDQVIAGSFTWPSKIKKGAETLQKTSDPASIDKPVDSALNVYFSPKRDTLQRNSPSNQMDVELSKKKLRDNLGDVSGMS